ncbi:putative metal dependent phosphohydrolase [Magnetofaba australis IT-1]|uniref:Putative metal dependent phosphohydrolase n=2 Tax=Magnetofaba TaxID=1472292 RepID=A0A1Y2K6R6_9PROT|nr:putative metal dependent phosphohydrolase [Magnetofaba australis IT-1]
MMAFALWQGMLYAQIQEAGMGGLLHDLGKIRVPIDILKKREQLNDNDWALLRMHVAFTQQVLQTLPSAPSSQTMLRAMREHHERLDGSGYPDGLRGESIGQEGRMLAICDVFDAMTSERAYHNAVEPRKVLNVLMEACHQDNHLDRELVEKFVRCIGIYPTGTLVRLENGYLGVVLRNDPKDLLHPAIRIVKDGQGRKLSTPKRLDLCESSDMKGWRIVGSETPLRAELDPRHYLPGATHYFTT